jgi:hypothetical protein
MACCARWCLPWGMNSPRGSGSLLQRRPGVWEVRVALGADPVSGRCRQRSVTVRGDCAEATQELARWAGLATVVRVARRSDPGVSLARLLQTWLGADHGWRPSTVAGYRSVVAFLVADPLGHRRASTLTPAVLRVASTGWLAAGAGEATVWGRVRVLRSALGWAYTERILDRCPLDLMRGLRCRGPARMSRSPRSWSCWDTPNGQRVPRSTCSRLARVTGGPGPTCIGPSRSCCCAAWPPIPAPAAASSQPFSWETWTGWS